MPPIGPLELLFGLPRMLFLKNFTLFRSESKYPLLKTCTSHLGTHLIPVATVTNFPKHGRLRQHTLIARQFQKSGIQTSFTGPRSRWRRAAFPLEALTETVFQPLQSHPVDALVPFSLFRELPSVSAVVQSPAASLLPGPLHPGPARSSRTVQGQMQVKTKEDKLAFLVQKARDFPHSHHPFLRIPVIVNVSLSL